MSYAEPTYAEPPVVVKTRATKMWKSTVKSMSFGQNNVFGKDRWGDLSTPHVDKGYRKKSWHWEGPGEPTTPPPAETQEYWES